MPNATITISWDGTNINASQTTITANQNANVNVTWATDTTVSAINNITTPTSSGGGTLSAPTSNNGVWSLSDQLGTTAATYAYTMTIVTSSNSIITRDPQIVNNPT